MDFPQIMATTTSTAEIVTQTQTVTFDRWWIRSITITPPDSNGISNAIISVHKGRKLENENWEMSPNLGDMKEFSIPNLFGMAEGSGEATAVISGLLTLIETVGKQMGEL